MVECLHRFLQEDVQIVLLQEQVTRLLNIPSLGLLRLSWQAIANITFDVNLLKKSTQLVIFFHAVVLNHAACLKWWRCAMELYHWFMRLVVCVIQFNPSNPIEGTGTGFSFDNLTPYWLNWSFQTALDVYKYQPEVWRNLQKKLWNGFPWDTACKSYLDLYHSLVN